MLFKNFSFLNSVFQELISFFKSRAYIQTDDIRKRSLVVGMVGYPNVGKSSTINKLLNQKKVAVSATPGKTRHLQTLVVDEEVNYSFGKQIRTLSNSVKI